MKRFLIPLSLLALAGALATWWFSPVQVVKRRAKTLLHTLTLESGSGRAGRHLATYTLNALLASEVELESSDIREANGTFDRAEMESAFSWLCDQAKQTRFDLDRFQSVTVDGDRAKTVLSLDALVELPNYRPADGRYDAVFEWQRGEDGWRLTSAQWRKTVD
jgi:hypothetical protein